MTDYIKTPTSREVWAVIHARHGDDLMVFSSLTNVSGDPRFSGHPDDRQIYTAYGFRGADFPIIAARTTWKAHPEDDLKRLNEKHEFWLCSGTERDA